MVPSLEMRWTAWAQGTTQGGTHVWGAVRLLPLGQKARRGKQELENILVQKERFSRALDKRRQCPEKPRWGWGLGRRSQEKQGTGRSVAHREFKKSAFFISLMESWEELASVLGGAQAPHCLLGLVKVSSCSIKSR